jgi:hypothetical protein
VSERTGIISERAILSLPSKVSRIAQGLLISVGIVSTGVSIAGEWFHGRTVLDRWLLGNFTTLGATLNLLLVLLVLFPGRIQDLNEDLESPEVRIAARCVNAFSLRAWTWFWACLGLVYVTVLFRSVLGNLEHSAVQFGIEGAPSMLSAVVLDLSTTGSTFFLLLVFLFLTPSFLRAFAGQETVPTRPSDPVRARWMDWPHFWFALWLLPVSLLVVFARLHVLQVPYSFGLDECLSVALGLFSAMALGAFAGRMDSKFILDWQWVIPVLFLYAGIQVYSPVLYEAAPVNRAVFVYGAFTMKCVLFVFVSNFFEERRVLYYAFEILEGRNRTV